MVSISMEQLSSGINSVKIQQAIANHPSYNNALNSLNLSTTVDNQNSNTQ